jgi:hypothetical protein
MTYALVALVVAVLGEAGALYYLWTRYRAAQSSADVSVAAAAAAGTALSQAYLDLAKARDALAKHNAEEAQTDAKVVATAPGLADAIARINGLH